MRTFIDFVYTILIGVGVILFVSLGIWAFYSGPKAPQYPQGPYIYKEPTAQQQKQMADQQRQFDKSMNDYNNSRKPYSRNVSMVSLVAGVLFFAGGVFLIKKNDVVGEGLALGGAFTGVYAAIRAVVASSKPLVFISVSLILIMLVLLPIFRRRWLPKRA